MRRIKEYKEMNDEGKKMEKEEEDQEKKGGKRVVLVLLLWLLLLFKGENEKGGTSCYFEVNGVERAKNFALI